MVSLEQDYVEMGRREKLPHKARLKKASTSFTGIQQRPLRNLPERRPHIVVTLRRGTRVAAAPLT
jgi:hypothetical protein